MTDHDVERQRGSSAEASQRIDELREQSGLAGAQAGSASPGAQTQPREPRKTPRTG